MDRRILKTRAAIFAAFEELLAEKRYEQISVSDIIDRANIGRSTFYAHFETKDALFVATCEELFAHIFAPHGRETTHDFSEDHGSLRARLTHILYHLKDDRARYHRIFSCESADLFWSYFKRRLAEIAAQKEAPARGAKELPKDFYINFYCSAFCEAVKWWFANGLAATPEELEAYFEAVTG